MSCDDRPRCKCGQPIRNSNDDRCEDCFADAQQRWNGKSQRVKTDRPDLMPNTKSKK